MDIGSFVIIFYVLAAAFIFVGYPFLTERRIWADGYALTFLILFSLYTLGAAYIISTGADVVISILLGLYLLVLLAMFAAHPFMDERRIRANENLFLLLFLAAFGPLGLAYILSFRKKPTARTVMNNEEHELSSLLAERERVINALKELDFDNQVGKIPADVYPEQRKSLLAHGAGILRRIDELQGEPAREIETAGAEERIEAAISTQRRLVPAYSAGNGSVSGGVAAIKDAEDDIEVAIANRRRARNDKAGGFCPKCGKPVQVKDKFCPKCGVSL